MNLKNKFNVKRIVSGLLASIMLSQAFIYGDGTCKGLLHTETINAISNNIEIQQNKQDLIDKFEQNVDELKNFNQHKTSLFSLFKNDNNIQIDSLNVSGYVGFEDNRPCEATIIVFNDNWETIVSTTTDSNGWFSVETGNIINTTSTTHIKIECNGYLPRFYKDMGFGSYQLGTQDNPEVLLCGDTTYNEWSNNQWSDEIINDNDINFIQQSVGTYTQNSNYDEYYDTNEDGIIDDTDISYLSSFLGYYYDGNYIKSSDDSITLEDSYMNIFRIDYNGNNIIEQDEIDYFLGLYPLGTIEYKGNSSLQYMDIDEDGYISQDDANYLINYATKNNGLNPYNDYISNIILTGDTYHNGAMYLENTNLDLNGYKLVINGNFVFRTANPYNSMWNDNPAVTLNINGGTLYIKEQFDFGQANSYDKIIMDKENGELYIFGNWNYITLADMEGLWTDGTIYFCGANWQVNEASGDKSVYSTEKHSIWFYYEYGQQVIRWDNTKDYTFDPITGKKTTPRALNFSYTDSSTGTCLGVFFPYGYTDDRYYFRPSLPDYITNYKDEDGNGIDDSIDEIFNVPDGEEIDYSQVPNEWIYSVFKGDTDIEKFFDPDVTSETEANKEALAKLSYDKESGNENVNNAFEVIHDELKDVAENIPEGVKLAYDGVRFIISIIPLPQAQAIDLALDIAETGYDLLTFEPTAEWLQEFLLDTSAFLPFVGTTNKLLKNVDIKALEEVKGAIDYVFYRLTKGSFDDVGNLIKNSDEIADSIGDVIDETKKLVPYKETINEIVKYGDNSKYQLEIAKTVIENVQYGLDVLTTIQKYKEYCSNIIEITQNISDIANALEIIDIFEIDGINALARYDKVTTLDAWVATESYRKDYGLTPFSKDDGDNASTIAFTDINGQRIFGTNSSLYSNTDIQLMNDYHNYIVNNPNKPSILNKIYGRGTSVTFTHAEGNVLVKAYDTFKTNSMPKTITIYCDRETCANWCRNYQIEIARGLDIESLIFVNSNGKQYLCSTKNNMCYYRIWPDGTIEKLNYSAGKINALRQIGIT